MVKFSVWLLQLVNYIDQAFPDLVYMLPDHVIQIPFEVLRMIKRESQIIIGSGMPICLPNYGQGISAEQEKLFQGYILEDQQSPLQQTFYQEIVTFLSRHFIDDRIANPDLKEIYLVRLNILFQYNQFIKTFEGQDFAQENLILMLMRSFGKNINLRHVTKNILRLAKGQGFKEIVYEDKIEKTHSPYFLYKLRVQLLNLDSQDTKEFLNAFFNSLNDVTSELFITFKELKNNYSQSNLRKTKSYFETSVDLLRMAELFATWCPELFLDTEHVHSSRLLNFLMFTLNSVLVGETDKHIAYFAEKCFSLSTSLEQYLAPFIGILVNMYMGIKQQQNEESKSAGSDGQNKYETLASLFQKTDTFNERGLKLFKRLKEVVTLRFEDKFSDSEAQFMSRYEQMIKELTVQIELKEKQT